MGQLQNYMALPTCNPWTSNTVRQSQQVAACNERSARAAGQELEDVTFLLTVLDSLQRLAVKGATGFQNLSAYIRCDGEANAHNAYVQLNELSAPIQANSTELKQLILWQLANPMCSLGA